MVSRLALEQVISNVAAYQLKTVALEAQHEERRASRSMKWSPQKHRQHHLSGACQSGLHRIGICVCHDPGQSQCFLDTNPTTKVSQPNSADSRIAAASGVSILPLMRKEYICAGMIFFQCRGLWFPIPLFSLEHKTLKQHDFNIVRRDRSGRWACGPGDCIRSGESRQVGHGP